MVNPGIPIPPFISQLTGITDEMVQDAPAFEQIAPQVEQLTRNCIFVAHNVQFDYNFVRQEFARLGLPFERDRLCTVKLSRHFLPGKLSYSLGRLCEDVGISISARHRAAGDAEATVKLLEIMFRQAGTEQVNGFVSAGSPFDQLNKKLKSIKLEDVPQRAGVLYLLDAEDKPIFIEGTTNLRRRAVSYLKNKAGKVGKTIMPHIKDVWFEETGSQLLAILLANERVLKEKPAYNKAASAAPVRWKITAQEGGDGFLYLGVARSDEGVWGPFASRKLAQEKLGLLLNQFFLCRRYSNFKNTDCAPASCLKACQGNEQTDTYNKRALAAISATSSPAGGKLLVDKGRYGNERVVIFENELGGVAWGYFEGSTKSFTEEELATNAVYPLKSGNAAAVLRRFLLKNSVQKVFSYGQKVVAAGF
ncbi:exonuclease [Flammeovirgaceae bacterium 311]|nr:exonuclease [Flammeovirgaceae bacterium 311]